MAKITEVKLPKDEKPIFPDRCVVCGAERPGTTTRVSNTVLTWWTLFFAFGGETVSVDVPACRWCGRRLHLNHYVEYAIALAIGAALIYWGTPLMREWVPRSLRLIVGIVAFVVVMMPISWIWDHFSHAFGISAFQDTIDYHFRDAKYAEEFGELNGTWQSVLRRSLSATFEDDDEDSEEMDDEDADDDSPEEDEEEVGLDRR